MFKLQVIIGNAACLYGDKPGLLIVSGNIPPGRNDQVFLYQIQICLKYLFPQLFNTHGISVDTSGDIFQALRND
jgi:hypothetical protein